MESSWICLAMLASESISGFLLVGCIGGIASLGRPRLDWGLAFTLEVDLVGDFVEVGLEVGNLGVQFAHSADSVEHLLDSLGGTLLDIVDADCTVRADVDSFEAAIEGDMVGELVADDCNRHTVEEAVVGESDTERAANIGIVNLGELDQHLDTAAVGGWLVQFLDAAATGGELHSAVGGFE